MESHVHNVVEAQPVHVKPNPTIRIVGGAVRVFEVEENFAIAFCDVHEIAHEDLAVPALDFNRSIAQLQQTGAGNVVHTLPAR
jgi:hypothetical protein